MGLIIGMALDPYEEDDPTPSTRPKKRRRKGRKNISFNPKATVRQFSGGGTLSDQSHVMLKPGVSPKTFEEKEKSLVSRDIKYVFMNVLALFAHNQNTWLIDSWIDTKGEERIYKEMQRGREREYIHKATKEDLLKLSNRAVSKMEESGLDLTLVGDAGRMKIHYDMLRSELNFRVLKSFQKYLIRETIDIDF